MAKGDGSIREIKRGVYQVTVYFGHNPITRNYDRVQRTVRGTKRDAVKVRDKIRRDREDGLTVDGSKMTFAEFAEQWQNSRELAGELSIRTLKDGQSTINRLIPYIGDMKLADISARHIERLYVEVRKSSKTGQPLSGSTMNKLHIVLKQILQHAVNLECISKNPCALVKAPKRDTVERRSLSEAQAKRLIQLIEEAETETLQKLTEKEHRQFERGNGFGRSQVLGMSDLANLAGVRIILATGLRRGEALGLTWRNINLERGIIRVTQKLDAYGGLGNPKSKAGRRTLSIGKHTVEKLTQWKATQAALLRKLSIAQSPDTFVCCSNTGGVADYQNFGRWWNDFRAEEFDGWKLHELRHTQATHLIKNGVDIKTVQTRLGHSTAALTLDTYAHSLPEKDEEAAEAFEEMIYAEPQGASIIEVIPA